MALPSTANYSHVVDSDDEHETGSSPARKKPCREFDIDNPSVTKCHWPSVVRRSLCAVSFILLALSGYLLSRSTAARESNQELRKAAPLTQANTAFPNQTDSRYSTIVSTNSSNPGSIEVLPAGLCWSSSILGGSRISLNETGNFDEESLFHGKNAIRPGGVIIYGDGCKRCHVGQTCSLYIAVQSPARWIPASASSSLQWDMMVTLKGPSLIHVHLTTVMADSPGQSVFLASYTPWDAGNYSMEFRVDGSNLNYTKDWNRLGQHVFAQIPVSVLEGSQTPEWLEQPQLDEVIMDLSAVTSPCAHGIAGRWLADNDGTSQNGLTNLNTATATTDKYRWAFFSCARAAPLNDMLWSLWKDGGVREVNVIGDSHMRGLIMHLWFMHTGTRHNMTLVRHGDVSYALNVTAPAAAGELSAGGELVKEGIIRVKYNWLDGIYDNNVAGCSRRGKYSNHTSSYPAPSPTADVTVVGTGHWTFEFCSDGAVAYPHYLPHFLSSLHLLRPKKPAVFFGLPSFWVANKKWIRRTNAMLAYGNGIAQPLVRHMGLSFFDTWQVTAPQYRTTCSLADPHYSCPDGNGGMRGEVGEAVVKAFVHFLSVQLSKGTP